MSQPPRAGFFGDTLRVVLGYIDSPWKAVVVITLVVVGGVGWVAYEKRDILIEEWMTPSMPALKTSEVPEALGRLAAETNADLVQIWAIDLPSNSQWFLGARRNDGERPVIPSPRRLPILDHASDVRNLVAVLEGHPTCLDLVPTGTPVARRMADRGMKRGCAVPIPPNRDSFVGVIYLAWATPTDDSNENVAVGAAREIADKLATH